MAGVLLLAAALVGVTTDGELPPAPEGDEIAPGDEIEAGIDDETRLRRLLAVTGFEARSALLASMMSYQVTASLGGHTGHGTEKLSRLLSNPIAYQVQRTVATVPNGEGEHSLASLSGAPRPPTADGFQQDFRVRMPPKGVAHSPELGSEFTKVVDLAVVGQHVALAVRHHWLGAFGRGVEN